MAKQDYLAGGANYFGNRKSNEAAAPNNGDLNGILRSRLATDAWARPVQGLRLHPRTVTQAGGVDGFSGGTENVS
jgi:hypothetical protein